MNNSYGCPPPCPLGRQRGRQRARGPRQPYESFIWFKVKHMVQGHHVIKVKVNHGISRVILYVMYKYYACISYAFQCRYILEFSCMFSLVLVSRWWGKTCRTKQCGTLKHTIRLHVHFVGLIHAFNLLQFFENTKHFMNMTYTSFYSLCDFVSNLSSVPYWSVRKDEL